MQTMVRLKGLDGWFIGKEGKMRGIAWLNGLIGLALLAGLLSLGALALLQEEPTSPRMSVEPVGNQCGDCFNRDWTMEHIESGGAHPK